MKENDINRTIKNITTLIQSKGQPLFHSDIDYRLNTQFVFGSFLFVNPDTSGTIIQVEEIIQLLEANDPKLTQLKIGINYAEITQHICHEDHHYFRGNIPTVPTACVIKRINQKSLIDDYRSKAPFCWDIIEKATHSEIYDITYIIYLFIKYPVLQHYCSDMVFFQLQRCLKQPDIFSRDLQQQLEKTLFKTTTLQ